MSKKEYSVKAGEQTLTFSVGKLAQQANASVLARLGGTEVLATVVMSKEVRDDIDYFPLMVDYEEKLYAAGKIKGSRFVKTEGRPSDAAVLSARVVDRAIRPLFPKWIKNDVQVVLTVLSFDKENDPDVVSLNAAVAALMISDVPWEGPIAGLRIGYKDGGFNINPNYKQTLENGANLVFAGTDQKTLMLEADAHEIGESEVFEMIKHAQEQSQPILDLFNQMQKEIGQKKISEPIADKSLEDDSDNKVDYMAETEKFVKENIEKTLFAKELETKQSRKDAVGILLENLDEALREMQIGKEKRKSAIGYAKNLVEIEVTRAIIEEDRRVDGRGLDEVRPLDVEVGLLARTHGSGLFTRGETQVLSVATLDAPGSEQILDTLEEDDTKKRYFHHYNFPPFSVGEARPLRGPGRREVGHGALAEKALQPLIPAKEDFPYTIRVVSEVLGSNGSSSMGSVCGSSLALMNAGVPIQKTVAGVAMGLASTEDGKYKVLTDLQDLEDGPGGMDFKVAGTKDGITAIQLDTKTKGLTNQIVEETLTKAKKGRMDIISVMEGAIKEPAELSEFAPRITTLKVDTEKIGAIIGPSGKTINKIIEETGVEIDIDDDGLVMITSDSPDGAKKAEEWVKSLVHEVAVGEKYTGTVKRIMDFGAFVEILPGQEGMVHISKLANQRVEKVEDVVKLNDKVDVEVIEIDDMGRINLKIQGVEGSDQNRPRGDRGGRGGHNRDRHHRNRR